MCLNVKDTKTLLLQIATKLMSAEYIMKLDTGGPECPKCLSAKDTEKLLEDLGEDIIELLTALDGIIMDRNIAKVDIDMDALIHSFL